LIGVVDTPPPLVSMEVSDAGDLADLSYFLASAF
jgi:hypothetical protein